MPHSPSSASAAALVPRPMLAHERVYVGIDIGKRTHVAGLLSPTLLKRHIRFEACPSLTFLHSREGFTSLLEQLETYTTREQLVVLVENTGHYHRVLVEFLQEQGIRVYMIHVQKRYARMIKSDKRDALFLANHLYNQLEKDVQVADRHLIAHPFFVPSEACQRLRSLSRHRYELVQEATARKNKLTALCDELFPELTQVFRDPNLPLPRALRAAFPTPAALARASLPQLREVAATVTTRVSDERLMRLQALAATSIGTTDGGRVAGLTLEQGQVIAELDLIATHLEQLHAEIVRVVTACREGQILLSLPGMGPVLAAALLAKIGSISNFRSAADLKSYLGWAPRTTQTGTSLNSRSLTSDGARMTRQALYMLAMNVIRMDTEWKAIYDRLVPLKCRYDERTGRYTGKLKVLGRICGQIIEMLYMFLTTDAALVAATPPGEEPPSPMLYDRAIHASHRNGGYHPAKAPAAALPQASVLPFAKKP